MNKAVIIALLLCVTTLTGCIGGEDSSSTDNQLDPVSNLDEEEISQRFANLTASYENLAADLVTLSSNYEAAIAKNIELQNEIKDLEVEIAVTTTHNEMMNSTITDQDEELSNLREKLEASNDELNQMQTSFDDLNFSLNSAQNDINNYVFALDLAQDEYAMLQNNFTMLQSDFNSLSADYSQMKAEFDEWKTYQSITNWNFDGDCPTEYVMSYSSGIDNGDNNGDAGNHVLEDGEIDHSASVCKAGMSAITNSTSGGYMYYLTEFNGKLYYQHEGNADYGRELWISDYYGNAEMLKDINTGEADSYPWIIGQTEDLLFFRATNSLNGHELWVTDGTESGTNMVKDINPGTNSGFNGYYGFSQYLNGKFYFGANNGTTGQELWATDGTENGTYLVKEIRGEDSNGNNYGSNPNGYTIIGDTMYFYASDNEHGTEPWMTDGTVNGTRMLKDIREGASSSSNGCATGVATPCDSSFQPFYKFGDQIFFVADDGSHGSEIWVTDGTANGTRMFKDIREEGSDGNNHGSTSCDYHKCFFEFDNKLWFQANEGIHGHELWYTDGTEAGTLMFSDIRDGSDGSNPLIHFNTEDYFYFRAHDGDSYRLFMTDGKQMIMDLDVHSDNVFILGTPVMLDGEFYMSLYTQPTGYELWKSDGTSDGTVMVHEFGSGDNGGNVRYLIVVNSELLFMLADPGSYSNVFAYAPAYYDI